MVCVVNLENEAKDWVESVVEFEVLLVVQGAARGLKIATTEITCRIDKNKTKRIRRLGQKTFLSESYHKIFANATCACVDNIGNIICICIYRTEHTPPTARSVRNVNYDALLKAFIWLFCLFSLSWIINKAIYLKKNENYQRVPHWNFNFTSVTSGSIANLHTYQRQTCMNNSFLISLVQEIKWFKLYPS